jgi:hypothetical protein
MEHEIDLHPDLSRQVEDAIKAINDFNRVADRTPEKLQIASGRVIDKLKIEGRDFLAKDAQQFSDHTLGSAGAVAKGTITLIDQKMQAYLDAMKRGLEDALPRIKAEKARDKAIELLRLIKIDVRPLDPFVELVNPNKLTVQELQTYTGQIKGFNYSSVRIIELSGFGFDRAEDEPTDFRVKVVGEQERYLSEDAIIPSTPFIFQINLSRFTPKPGDIKLLVSWGKKILAQIPFETTVVKDDPPPPVPTVISAWLVSNTGNENKDKNKGYSVHISVHPKGPMVAETGTISNGEEYPNGLRGKKVDVPIKTSGIDARNTFHLYVPTEANLDWDATFSVTMLVDTGGTLREYNSPTCSLKQFRHKDSGGPESHLDWEFRLAGL